MLATDVLIAITVILAILAAIATRIALSLKDIGSSLDRIAEGMVERPSLIPDLGLHLPLARPDDAVPSDTEMAAVIAAAARFSGAARSSGARGSDIATQPNVERTT